MEIVRNNETIKLSLEAMQFLGLDFVRSLICENKAQPVQVPKVESESESEDEVKPVKTKPKKTKKKIKEDSSESESEEEIKKKEKKKVKKIRYIDETDSEEEELVKKMAKLREVNMGSNVDLKLNHKNRKEEIIDSSFLK